MQGRFYKNAKRRGQVRVDLTNRADFCAKLARRYRQDCGGGDAFVLVREDVRITMKKSDRYDKKP